MEVIQIPKQKELNFELIEPLFENTKYCIITVNVMML